MREGERQGCVRTRVCAQRLQEGQVKGSWCCCHIDFPTQLNVKTSMEIVFFVNSRRAWMTESFSVTNDLEPFRKSLVGKLTAGILILGCVCVCFITTFIQSQVIYILVKGVSFFCINMCVCVCIYIMCIYTYTDIYTVDT